MGGERVYGPFSGDPEGAMTVRRVSYPPDPHFVVRSDTQSGLIDLCVKLKFFTKYQAVRLLGAAAEKQLKALHRAGYIDALSTGKTPPVYTWGPGLQRLLTLERPHVRMPGPLRVVAANQFFVALGGKAQYEVPGLEWPTALLKADGAEYWVLAPRVWPEEELWLDSALDYMDPGVRVIVIAASEGEANDAAVSLVARGVAARYSWDTVLKDGFSLFRYTAHGFIEDEKALDFFKGRADNVGEGASPSIAITTTQLKHD